MHCTALCAGMMCHDFVFVGLISLLFTSCWECVVMVTCDVWGLCCFCKHCSGLRCLYMSVFTDTLVS